MKDVVDASNILLFHGAKTKIEDNLSLDCSKRRNDFGAGFYCGESFGSGRDIRTMLSEKEYYLTSKQESYEINRDKVKVARKQYRGQGEYIEDILK